VKLLKKCEICGKGVGFGNKRSHANNATRRLWRPNLQPATILLNGEKVKARVCTKCLKTAEKA